jgi:hypothetical protein
MLDRNLNRIASHIWKAKSDGIAMAFSICLPSHWMAFFAQHRNWISTLCSPLPLGPVHPPYKVWSMLPLCGWRRSSHRSDTDSLCRRNVELCSMHFSLPLQRFSFVILKYMDDTSVSKTADGLRQRSHYWYSAQLESLTKFVSFQDSCLCWNEYCYMTINTTNFK